LLLYYLFIFSSIIPQIGTQNYSFFSNTQNISLAIFLLISNILFQAAWNDRKWAGWGKINCDFLQEETTKIELKP